MKAGIVFPFMLLLTACLLLTSCVRDTIRVDYDQLLEDCEDAESAEDLQRMLKRMYGEKMIAVEGRVRHGSYWYDKEDQQLRLETGKDLTLGLLVVTGSLAPDTPEYFAWNDTGEGRNGVVEGVCRSVIVSCPEVYEDNPEDWVFDVREATITLRLSAVSSFSPTFKAEDLDNRR